jgi:hypothetical protein
MTTTREVVPAYSGQVSSEQAREERAYAVGIQAALWGRAFPEYVHSAYAGMKAGAAYMNYLHKFADLKTAADRYVNTPNNVSIDAYGNADLAAEPAVIFVPALKERRWYIVQVGDMFDEIVYNIGGSKGPEPGLFLLTGPDYHGRVPANMTEIRVRTKLAVVANRVFVNGAADVAAARDLQQGIHMMPLSVFQRVGLRYEIAESDVSRLEFIPAGPESLRIFEQIGFGMHLFLSASDDVSDPMVESFHHIGLSVARGFEWQTLDDAAKRGLARAAVVAEQIVDDAYAHSAEIVNGWRYTMGGGRAGYDLALRAALATHLLGANVPEQILYPNVTVDDQNRPLSGENAYVLRFDKGEIPPVSVFWNLSMYDDKEFFIENDFGRYSIGSTTDGLKTDADGSITLHIQHDDPGAAKQSNWLPAPAGSFNLTMRLYGAETPILDGSYRLPPVRRA